jgi:uncharacterized protein YceH (UPF0502 family)
MPCQFAVGGGCICYASVIKLSSKRPADSADDDRAGDNSPWAGAWRKAPPPAGAILGGMTIPTLSLLETRILGVLVEKQHTVPDSYPLSLNALTLGCNQKTARDPVINASEGDVLAALDTLKSLHLVLEGSGSRVPRFEHNVARVLKVPGQSVALLAMLMLRGPQTAAELRLNTERLHRFADISAVEGFLDEMATHEPPFVLKLARAPGARESRWAHLLSGPVVDAAPAAPMSGPGTPLADAALGLSEVAALRAEQLRMKAELERLRAQVARLATELGVELDAD